MTSARPASGGLPRPIEATVAFTGLVILAPLLAVIAAVVGASSRGGVLFRQRRIGRGGGAFTLYKFRTMRPGRGGPRITAAGDARVTAVGRILRRFKVDELPQLWNILRGDMSFVGPRPEVPEYVEVSDPLWRRVLAVRPGLTDPVTLRLRNEEELLAGIEGDRLRFYRETLLPFKLKVFADYLERRTVWSDLVILGKTKLAVLFPNRTSPPSREEIEAIARSCDRRS